MNKALLSIVAVSAFGLCANLAAQAKWTQLTPANAPSKRANSHMTSDLLSAYVFAGNLSGTVYYNDLWRYDGTNWTEVSPNGAAGAPTARRWGSVAYDFARNELVVFGGQRQGGAHLDDTWTWNGTAWTQHTTPTAPSARRWATMQYDWASNRVILFGGYDGTTTQGDTWAWTGTAWVKLNPTNSPSARGRCSMAALEHSKEIVLYGGTPGTTSPALSDMWKWDGSDWSSVTTSNAPYTTGLLTAPMYWDRLRERLVIFGGYNGFERRGTWEFHAGTWTQRMFTTEPIARSRPGMAYIQVFDKAIMFGGFGGPVARQLGDTWEYQTDAPASINTAGTGCSGSAGVPTITNKGLPWIDDAFQLDIANLSIRSIPMLIVGTSKTMWSGGTLPFNLGPLGFPSCDLLVSTDLLISGVSSFTLPIPNDTNLIGFEIYFQAAALGPANIMGASSRTEVKIGAR